MVIEKQAERSPNTNAQFQRTATKSTSADGGRLSLKSENGMTITVSTAPIMDMQHSLIFTSPDEGLITKLNLFPNVSKTNTVEKESEILWQLRNQNSNSSPEIIASGPVTEELIVQLLPRSIATRFANAGVRNPYFITMRNIQSVPSEKNNLSLPDILLAVAEQKALGWFHCDIHAGNIVIEKDTNRHVLIDYDQAIPLTQEQRLMPFRDYLIWANHTIRSRYNRDTRETGLFGFFGHWNLERDVFPLLEGDRLKRYKVETVTKPTHDNEQRQDLSLVKCQGCFYCWRKGPIGSYGRPGTDSFSAGRTSIGCRRQPWFVGSLPRRSRL